MGNGSWHHKPLRQMMRDVIFHISRDKGLLFEFYARAACALLVLFDSLRPLSLSLSRYFSLFRFSLSVNTVCPDYVITHPPISVSISVSLSSSFLFLLVLSA